MKKQNILLACIIAVLTILTILIILTPSRREHHWDISAEHSKNGGEPYDVDILDSLLTRSLTAGYSTRRLSEFNTYRDEEIRFDYKDFPMLSEIANTSTDTSLIIIKQYPWKAQGTNNVIPLFQLANFAQRGGKALLVMPIFDSYLNYDMSLLNIDDKFYSSGSDYRANSNGAQPYTPKWYEPEYYPWTLSLPSGDMATIDGRMCINYFKLKNGRKTEGQYYCKDMRPDHDENQYVVIKPMLIDQGFSNSAYAIDIYYPRSGGHLYVTLLGLPFTNMGLTSPGAHKVVEALVSKLDDKPVIRLYYPKVSYDNRTGKSSKSALLSVIQDNEALSYVWTLALVLIVLILSCGLVRRHPAVKGIEAEDIDRTDAMAVREYQFRKSPLLHFLFQCSWLYNGAKNYRELLDTNYRQLARIVNRYADVELSTADEKALSRAAQVFAQRQSRNAEDVLEELKWIQTFVHNPESPVTPDQYKHSQEIIEKFK